MEIGQLIIYDQQLVLVTYQNNLDLVELTRLQTENS